MKKKADGFFVSESLTLVGRNIFYTLRSIRKAHPGIVKGVTMREGRVYAFTKPRAVSSLNGKDQRHLKLNEASFGSCIRSLLSYP